MKLSYKIIHFLVFIFLLTSELYSENIKGMKQEVSSYGETFDVDFNAKGQWSVKSDAPWLSFSKNGGSLINNEKVELKIFVEFNHYDNRRAVVNFVVNGENKIFQIRQDRWERPVFKYRVGDPEMSFDENKFDKSYKYYKQMMLWKTAGKLGGIPHLSDVLKKITKTFDANSTCDQIISYFEENKDKEIYVLLKNGNYHFTRALKLYSNATLIGESREGVIITLGPEFPMSDAIDASYKMNVGIRNLTINGAWLNEDGENTPKYDFHVELPGRGKHRTIDFGSTENSYIDDVNLYNNASHPIWLGGKHNTVRGVAIDASFNKGGGCQGYFFVQGERNLITNCFITRIRHLSFQGQASRLNVFYDNDIRQEVTFHANDGGDNLIEYNRVYLPPTMREAYNAIMGPWSSKHKVGGLNFIFRNKCKEDNKGRGGKTPWSDEKLYLGPYIVSVGVNNPTRYTNFKSLDITDLPQGGTLYPVVLD